jgi:small-conductance mechanosensitive channel
MTFLVKILVSLAILAVDILVQTLTQRAIDRYVTRYRMSHKRNLVMHKTKSVLLHAAALIAIVLMWGVSIENVWVSIAGILGLVAIGFFAVWSILSNIFAGIVLFFNRPFKIEDTIELLPDGIRGRVKDINGFFVLLEDEDGHTINIPNNLVFQKIVKNLGR